MLEYGERAMLNRLLISWIAFAAIMGFALGGSFVSAYLAPPPQHQAGPNAESGAAEQNAKQKSDEAIALYTFWLTIFTGVMAFATIGLGFATVGLYVTGEKQIKIAIKAADAARISAVVAERTLTDLERPWLFLDATTVTRRNVPGSPVLIPNDWVIKLHWKNVGRAPAIIDNCLFKIVQRSSLPDNPDYSGMMNLNCPASVATTEEFETNEVGPARMGPDELVIFGKMIYRDLGERMHETGFAIAVSAHIPASMAHPNKKYFYLT